MNSKDQSAQPCTVVDRLKCDEPREHDTVPYQLHKFSSWAAMDYCRLQDAERTQRLRDTALRNAIALTYQDIKDLKARVATLEKSLKELQYSKDTKS